MENEISYVLILIIFICSLVTMMVRCPIEEEGVTALYKKRAEVPCKRSDIR